jgi:hypothetical protein
MWSGGDFAQAKEFGSDFEGIRVTAAYASQWRNITRTHRELVPKVMMEGFEGSDVYIVRSSLLLSSSTEFQDNIDTWLKASEHPGAAVASSLRCPGTFLN